MVYCIELDFPGTKEHLEFIDNTLTNFLKETGIEEYKKFRFALHEIIINSIQVICANEDPERNTTLRVRVEVSQEEISAVVTDWMKGIKKSKEAIIDAYDPVENLWNEEGRGIPLIEKMVDSYTWNLDEEGAFHVYISSNV